MRKITALLLATIASFAICGIAHAQMISAQSPGSIVRVLQKSGYRADLSKDSVGDPMIESASAGSNFAILFYGCVNNRNCSRVQFAITYTDYDNTSLDALNEWNARNYFGRAYLSAGGAARLEMDVDLSDGGMSAALFENNVEWWVSIMANFEKHISSGE